LSWNSFLWQNKNGLLEGNAGGPLILMKSIGFLLACCLVGLFFSCGIEEEIYLDPVEYASTTGVTAGEVTLPGTTSRYFRNFLIYYRIYISDHNTTSIDYTTDGLNNINRDLNSHHTYIYNNYINNENASFSTMSTVFSSRGYFPLYVSSDRINEIAMYDLLTHTSGGDIKFDFSKHDDDPFLTYSAYTATNQLFLFRAPRNYFESNPDRLFYLSDDLVATITNETNADVGPKANVDPSYAYVSMYILAVGINDNFSPVYSRPKHIGIFQLPGTASQ